MDKYGVRLRGCVHGKPMCMWMSDDSFGRWPCLKRGFCSCAQTTGAGPEASECGNFPAFDSSFRKTDYRCLLHWYLGFLCGLWRPELRCFYWVISLGPGKWFTLKNKTKQSKPPWVVKLNFKEREREQVTSEAVWNDGAVSSDFSSVFKGKHVDVFCHILLMQPKTSRIPSSGTSLLTLSLGMSFLVFGKIRASSEAFPHSSHS